MELHQALKNIIRCEGEDIVTDLRIINILNDLHAYEGIQGSKYILRAIIDDGFASRFYQTGRLNNQAYDLICRFTTTTGFNEESVLKIFHSLAFGLGWINQMPATPAPSPTPRPTPQPQSSSASHLNLTFSQLDNKSDSFKHQYARNAENYLDSIITILGNPQQELEASLSANVSFSGDYNTFDINLEVEGGIKCKFQYNIIFDIVLKSAKGKIIAKEEIYINKSDAKQRYFVKDVSIMEDEFHRVCDIAEIKIYWKID